MSDIPSLLARYLVKTNIVLLFLCDFLSFIPIFSLSFTDISTIFIRCFVNLYVHLSRTARPFVYSLQEEDGSISSFSGPFPPSFGQPETSISLDEKVKNGVKYGGNYGAISPQKNERRPRHRTEAQLQTKGSEPDNSKFDHRNSDFGNRDSDFDYRDAGIFIPKEPRPKIAYLETDSYPNPNMRKKSTNF